MRLIRVAFAAALFTGILATPAPASADVKTCSSTSWGAGCIDIDVVAGGQRVEWEVDDRADGAPCVYMWGRRVRSNLFILLGLSCGPVASGTRNYNATTIAGTVRVTQGSTPSSTPRFDISTSIE